MRFYISYTNRRHNTYGAGTLAGYGAHVRGWDAGADVTPHGDKGEPDSFSVTMTGGSHAAHPSVFLGTVHDTPSGPRWVPADPFLPGSIPGRVGSPAMEVVAAIPYGTDGREFKCVVIPASQRDMSNPSYGVVSAYRNRDGDDRWYSTGGHYDLTLSRAIRVMAERAGAIVRPSERDTDRMRELMESIGGDAGQQQLDDAHVPVWAGDIRELLRLTEKLLNEVTS